MKDIEKMIEPFLRARLRRVPEGDKLIKKMQETIRHHIDGLPETIIPAHLSDTDKELLAIIREEGLNQTTEMVVILVNQFQRMMDAMTSNFLNIIGKNYADGKFDKEKISEEIKAKRLKKEN